MNDTGEPQKEDNAYGFSYIKHLALGISKKLPIVIQTEVMECGLACIAMVAGYFGRSVDLADLRRRSPASQRGVTLNAIVEVAGHLNLSSRAVRVDLEALKNLRLPCVLHWNMTHFVVLKSVKRRGIVIHDPAMGERFVSNPDASAAFSGIALELWPGQHFMKQAGVSGSTRLLAVIGTITGLGRSFAQIIALAFVLQILALATPLFMQWVIDHAILSGNKQLLTALAVGFAVLIVATQAVSSLSSWISMYLSTSWSIQWSANVFTHMLRLPLAYFERRHLGDVVSRFQSMNVIQTTLTSAFIKSVVDGVMVVFVVALIFRYSPFLSWISVGAMAFYVGCRMLWYRPLRLATQEQIVHAAKQNTHFLETIRGARTIKLFQNQDGRRSAWLSLIVEQINSGLRVQKLQILYTLINGLAVGLVGVLLVWLAARMVLAGELTIGMMTAYMAYQAQFAQKVTSLVDRYFEVKMLQVHGDRLADIVLSDQEAQPGDRRLVVSQGDGFNPRIEARDLRFRYSDHDPYVLNGVDLTIEPGECVAISGPSGCGKSTFLHVLLGVLQPTSGELLFDGLSSSTFDPGALRTNIGCVTQNDVLLAGTVAENISFFESAPDQRWIEECAKIASIHDEIVAMPMGYNTFTGHMGSVLSGGQQQRVLLARALYRKPKILILDEATSHLDLAKEALVGAAVKNLAITRIMVAHRPQTLELADRIVTMSKGRVTSIRNSTSVIEVTQAAPGSRHG